MKDICYHVDEDGNSTLIFPKKNKFVGLYDAKVKCYCAQCHRTVEISKKEYEEIVKGGFR